MSILPMLIVGLLSLFAICALGNANSLAVSTVSKSVKMQTTAAPSISQYWDCTTGDSTGQYILATASYGTNGDYAYYSEDYGATYVKLGSTQNKWVACAMTLNKQTMYIGSSSSSGVFSKSTDGGATFTTVGAGTINYVSGVATDRNTGQYVVVACWSVNRLYYSSDYGATFTRYATNNRYSSVAASNDGSRFYVALYNGGSSVGSIYSTDYGVTWTASNLAAKPWSSISCTTDGQIVAITSQQSNSKVFLSTDYGVTFAVLANSPTGPQMLTVGISGGQNANSMYTLVVGDTSAAKLYYSSDTGNSWTANPTTMRPRSSFINQAGTTMAVGTGTYMFYSTNSGVDFCISAANSVCVPPGSPTLAPAPTPAPVPTPEPTSMPTSIPSVISRMPTYAPTYTPTATPTYAPTYAPTSQPSSQPSSTPTSMPTVETKVISLHNSGYLVGFDSDAILPVITIGPVFVLVIFSLFFCCVFKGGEEYVLPPNLATLAWITLFFTIVQFSVNLAGYAQLVRPWVGSWWIAIFTFLAVISTWTISSRTMAVFSMLMALMAFMVALICTVGDGLYYSRVLRLLRACVNQDGEVFGSTRAEYQYGLQTCSAQYDGYDLACTSRHNNRCYFFQGTSNGDFLMHRYTHVMEAGFAFDIALSTCAFFLFLYQLWFIFDQNVKYQRAATASAAAGAEVEGKPTSGSTYVEASANAEGGSTELVPVSSTNAV